MKRIGFIFTVITLFCLSAVSRVIAQSDWSLINFDLINLRAGKPFVDLYHVLRSQPV